VLDTRIEIEDDTEPAPEYVAEPIQALSDELSAMQVPAPAREPAPVAVTPPPAIFRPAQPAPGQIAAARVEARRAPVLSDREVLPNGERFEDAFVRSLTEGPGAIR